jgi:hypothetical protein
MALRRLTIDSVSGNVFLEITNAAPIIIMRDAAFFIWSFSD